jgi:outer membrane protein
MRFAIAVMVAACVLAAGISRAEAQGGLGFIDIQRIVAESEVGKAANARVQELSQQKLAEIEANNSELQGRLTAVEEQLQELQSKAEQGATVMSAAARLNLQREITSKRAEVERTRQDAQTEAQRVTQDADTEVQALQQELQIDFQQKLGPVIDQVATDRGLSFIFNATEGGLIWADQALDLTQELIDLLNAQTGAP